MPDTLLSVIFWCLLETLAAKRVPNTQIDRTVLMIAQSFLPLPGSCNLERKKKKKGKESERRALDRRHPFIELPGASSYLFLLLTFCFTAVFCCVHAKAYLLRQLASIQKNCSSLFRVFWLLLHACRLDSR
jgi:hypothetical protein